MDSASVLEHEAMLTRPTDSAARADVCGATEASRTAASSSSSTSARLCPAYAMPRPAMAAWASAAVGAFTWSDRSESAGSKSLWIEALIKPTPSTAPAWR
jgi:hypothetical protein